jgi:hypothetical protein
LIFDDFSFLLLTIFSIELLFFGRTRDLRYLSSQTYFYPAATAARSHLLKQSGDAKNNGEKRLSFDDFPLLLLTIFSIELLFSGRSRDL